MSRWQEIASGRMGFGYEQAREALAKRKGGTARDRLKEAWGKVELAS
jgi:hypothetical protein